MRLGGFEKRRAGLTCRAASSSVWHWRERSILQPSVLLLDEPLGALDAKLRKALRHDLTALQHELGMTVVYVTHDQEEALTLSTASLS